MSEIPVIDISPLMQSEERPRRTVATKLGEACHDIGFVVVRGHGIRAAAISQLRDAVIGFFDLPLDDKLAWSVSKGNYRGYIPLGFFTPNAARATGTADSYRGLQAASRDECDRPDLCRMLALRTEQVADRPTGFREAVLSYWQQCDRVATLLLDALACSLELDSHVFHRAFQKPLTNMTLLHYPPQSTGESTCGIHPHKDTDALTILAPDPVGGLQVKPVGTEQWISADAPDDALIVNIGDLLEVWSGGYFVSTPHRVLNTSGRERYSFPYFAVPRYDVVVSPLCTPQAGFERDAIPVGDVSRQVWYSNWPDAAPIDTRYDPATP